MAIPVEQRGRRLRLLLAYNLGRILSYSCAGLLLGLAGWAIARTPFAGALRVARRTSDAVVVVVFCDGGEKYLSERFWDERVSR